MPMTNPMRYGSTPPGSTTQIAYNNAGAWGAASSLTWDETLDVLGLDQVAVTMTGLAAVATAPTATLAGLGAGAIPAGAYNYKLQWYSLNADTAESTVSNNVTVAAGDGKVVITIPVHPSSKCVGVRVYRSAVTGVAPWRLVATITNNSGASYTDNAAAGTSYILRLGKPYGKIMCGTTDAISFDASGRVLIGGAYPLSASVLSVMGQSAFRCCNTDFMAVGVLGNSIEFSFGSATGATYGLITSTANGTVSLANLCMSLTNLGINTIAPTKSLAFGGNTARTIWLERHTTADTAGNNLTFQAGGCTSAATNKNGGVLTLVPGTTTGSGMASVRIHRALRSAAATTDNAYADAIVVPSQTTLTHDTATSLFEVSCPDGAMIGGTIEYTVTCTNGTDHQVHAGSVQFAAVRKGNTVTAEIIEETATDNADAVTAVSTLTNAWTILDGYATNKITVQGKFTSNLGGTPVYKCYYVVHNGSAQTITQI